MGQEPKATRTTRVAAEETRTDLRPQQADMAARDAAAEAVLERMLRPEPTTLLPVMIPTDDVMCELLAARIVGSDRLEPVHRQLLTRWGFQPDWVPLDGKLGLFAALLLPAVPDRAPVIVFRGTEAGSMDDLVADMEPAIGRGQFEANRAEIERLLARAGAPCIVTGKSLGGVLAQRVAARYPSAVRQVITFSAPGLAADELGGVTPRAPGSVRHHVDAADPIASVGAHLPGEVIEHHALANDKGILGDHLRPLFASPEYAEQRRALGIDATVMAQLDALYRGTTGREPIAPEPQERLTLSSRPRERMEADVVHRSLGGIGAAISSVRALLDKKPGR